MQRKPDGKIRVWQFDPKKGIEYTVIKIACEVSVFKSVTVEPESKKQKKGHLKQCNIFTVFPPKPADL